jgi:hypothetical protein
MLSFGGSKVVMSLVGLSADLHAVHRGAQHRMYDVSTTDFGDSSPVNVPWAVGCQMLWESDSVAILARHCGRCI